LEKPQLVSQGNSFSVILSNRSVFGPREEEWLSLFQPHSLSRLQKRIVVAGMDGKELSPEDIYRAMNTEDRDTYDLEVTGLRKFGILQAIRSSAAAQQMSKNRRVPKSKVPRFKVCQPVAPKAEVSSGLLTRAIVEPRGELYPEETGVFVGNLEPSTIEEELRSIFRRFGNVRKVISNWDKRPGVPSKNAVLWLDSADGARAAVETLYGFKLRGRDLQVQPFRAKRQRPAFRSAWR
jgi:ATP-dependent DNA helicase RecG